ncbi:MAG: HVO_2901 family zinc finger protein [Haloplanus sp.]
MPDARVSPRMSGMHAHVSTHRDLLVCRTCGAEFPEGRATKDGWHYECPECGEATGLGDGLRRV